MAANGNSLSYDFKSSPATCTGIPPCELCHLLLAQVGLTFFGSQLGSLKAIDWSLASLPCPILDEIGTVPSPRQPWVEPGERSYVL